MNISNELRVGIMFIAGLILLVLTIISLTRWGQGRNTYAFRIHFKHAQGLQSGAPVHVAGVEVGRVTTIDLDPLTNEPLVTVRIGHEVTVYDNYHFTIGMSGIVGEHFVEIIPVPDSGPVHARPIMADNRVEGYTVPDMNDVMAQASVLVGKLTDTTEALNSTLLSRGNLRNMQLTLENLRKTSENSVAFTNALTRTLADNTAGVNGVVRDITGISHDMRLLSDSLTPQLANTTSLHNIEIAAEKAATISKRLDHMTAVLEATVTDKELLAGVKDSVLRAKSVTEQIEALVGDTRNTLKTLPGIAANLQQVSDDLPVIIKPFKDIAPKTAADITQITTSLRAASDDLGVLAHRISTSSKQLDENHFDVEARVVGGLGPGEVGKSNFRSDLNFDYRFHANMIRAGVTDIGQDTGLNLQYGNRVADNVWLRYGVVQSQAGVGADWLLSPDLRLSAELFDPNTLRLNALAEYKVRPLGDSWWLTGGVYNVFDHPSFAAGVTYRP